MIIIKQPIPLKTISQQHNNYFKTMVKIVVDVEQKVLALDAELHADLEQLLLENGSDQKNLWGANVYFETGRIEFTSLINIRPGQGNEGMEVKNPEVKKQIENIVRKLII